METPIRRCHEIHIETATGSRRTTEQLPALPSSQPRQLLVDNALELLFVVLHGPIEHG